MEPKHLRFSVPGTAGAVAEARRHVVAEIRGWGLPPTSDVLDSTALVTSELLTNAVQHAGPGRITVAAHLDGNTVRVEISDSSTELPRPRYPGEDDEDGRGLFIVAALASRYDVELTEWGKRCWAEIPVHPAASPARPLTVPLPRRLP